MRAAGPAALAACALVAAAAPRTPADRRSALVEKIGAVPVPSAPASIAPPLPADAALRVPDAVAVDEAVRQLNSPDWVLQAQAIAVLARAKSRPAVAPLKEILAGKGRPWIRGRALVALAEILGRDALGDALALAADPSPELREAALEALGICGSPPAVAAVEARLADPVPSVRNQAVVALARLKGAAAWDRVAPLLADADSAAVVHAARALVYVGSPESRQALIGLLAHKEPAVRLAAAQAEREVRDPDAAPVLLKRVAADSTSEVKWTAERALLAYPPLVLAGPCLEALAAGDSSLYPVALRILAARPSHEARSGLANLLREHADRYRTVVLPALDVLAGADPPAGRSPAAGEGPSAYQDVFVRYLSGRDTTIRRRAVEILGQCSGIDHWALLKAPLADANEGVAVAAARALRKATRGAPPGGIVEYLAGVLKSGTPDAVEEALALLGERLEAAELPKALAALDPFLAGADSGARRLAVASLDRFADGDAGRRIAAAQGYLVQWMLLGPFPNDLEGRGMSAAYPPEYGVDFTRTYDAFPFGLGAAFKAQAAAAGGVARSALSIRPPEDDGAAGTTVVSFMLDLPQAKDIKLNMFWGIQQDAPEGEGVRFEAAVEGRKVLERKVAAADGWTPADVDLSPHAGRRVRVDLAVDALGNAAGDWALVGDPRVVADGAVAADLVKLAPSAAARIIMQGVPSARLSWEPARTVRSSGEVNLRPAIAGDELAVAYAAADVPWSSGPEKAYLALDSEGPAKLWVNGVKVAERTGAAAAAVPVAVEFRKGPNRLLLKVASEGDRWVFALRLTDGQGRALLPAKPAP